ncbi:MAG TPA: NADH-quinone oxidoreductase subunit NuoN [Actinomycetota bacterium]|nr:NADH-quinone oxidoreductase subunit NuoN [Actinomycetota bacterium]
MLAQVPSTPRLDLAPIGPELVLVGAAVVALLLDAVRPSRSRRTLLGVTLVGMAGAAAASLALWDRPGPATVLGGMVAADRLAVAARLLLLGVAALGALYATHYFERLGEDHGELYALLLFATSGMTLLAAAGDLVVAFLALEVLSLSLYVLAGLTLRLPAGEAAMKYFLLGAFSSAFFLYGVAFAYGASGTTSIGGLARALAGRPGSPGLALAAAAFLAVGFGFKVSAVPFHMWTPDVYQGAPTPITGFMSAATKVAAFAALIRVLDVGLGPLAWDWRPVVWALAAASVVLGSVVAIAQTDVKRMLAYSSIAHAGFILTGLVAPDQVGIRSALFYLVAYAAMILGAFGVVMLVSGRGEERTDLGAYAGLARRSPLLAALMSVFLLSLAGIPPTSGFVAKVGVFLAAVRAGEWELAAVGVLASVAAAFFYLRVIVLMYMREPEGEGQPDPTPWPRAAVAVPALVTLVLGVFPQLLLGVLERAAVLRW